MTEIIQVNIFGEDKPGLTTALTGVIAKYDADILDIGQANIHSSLTLGILIKTTTEKSGFVMKDLLFESSRLGVQIRFSPINEDEYERWVGRQGHGRYIVTLLGRSITAQEISQVTSVVTAHSLNIDAIKRLSGRIPLDAVNGSENKECSSAKETAEGCGGRYGGSAPIKECSSAKSCIELSVRGHITDEEWLSFRHDLMANARPGFDISFQKDDIYRRSRRLICFDMDSTLVGTECIDELAERAGVGEQVRAITESAMRGEIDFVESFTRRVALLKGLDESVMRDIAENLPFNEGLERMMKILKRVGYKTAILSGGFTYFAHYLQQRFGFDYVYANELEIEDGRLTGRYIGDVVDGRRKADLLRLLCQVEGIHLEQAVAVGDGANDLPMISLAGLGIAYHAKPKVKANASQNLSAIGLDGILYFLGLKDSQVE